MASSLLTTGHCRLSRNPLDVALSPLLAGFGLLLDSVWVLVAAGLALLLDRLVIAREEARLQAQCGEAYAASTGRVRGRF